MSHFHRDPAAFPDNSYLCMGSLSSLYHRSANRSEQTNKPHSLDDNDDSLPSPMKANALNVSDRLQHVTDTRVMAHMKEKSLQQDFVSIPATDTCRSPDTSLLSPSNYSYSNLEFDMNSLDRVINTPCARKLHYFQRSPFSQSPRSIAQPRYSSQLPRPSSQATTQSQVLKLAKSREELRLSMPNLNSSPRTSLRSLQAVRNSRHLEANGQLLTDLPSFQLTYPIADFTRSPTGASSVRLASGGKYSSVSAKTKETGPVAAQPSLRMSFQATSIRRQLSAQSLSPSGLRIPCPKSNVNLTE
ncbi:hypothetical protein UPYG_G00120440 [Umbra pygmaea]|uniref:Uncharacterized protein n=1 Tax=Umbra pygmaea TaxID=75934 RepID=A0ABD0X4V0_UMBPY